MEVRPRVSGVFPLSLLEMRVKCTATYRPGETREDPGSSLCGQVANAESLCVDDHQGSLHGVHQEDGRGLVKLFRVRSMVTKTMCRLVR